MAENGQFYKKNVRYLKRILQVIPGRFAAFDNNRVTFAYFSISGLDILGALHEIEDSKAAIIEWIYSLQVLPNESGTNLSQCGFRGCSSMGRPFHAEGSEKAVPYDSAHVTMTYTALACLLILGDDLSRVNRAAVMAGLRSLQQANGSFCSVPEGSETDMRFVYCACCVCYMLCDWSGMDREKTASYITASLSYDGGFGQGPGTEAHGGPTFCSVASLQLMGVLGTCLTPQQLRRLQRWCVLRQQSGFQGRPNKPVDTCYSFWVGATLELLGLLDKTSHLFNRSFILSTMDPMIGGLAKSPDDRPDPLHTYLGLSGLSLINHPGLAPLHPGLNISIRAFKHLQQLQQQWS